MIVYRLLKSNSGLIFFVSLLLLVASMPLSRFGLSVAQLSMLGIWLLDGNLKDKARTLFRDKAALALVSFYLLHVIGLLYTSDFQYAMKDLRVKLPMLFLPVVFATFPTLSKGKTRIILLVFMAAVLVASLTSLWIYLFREFNDFRDLSPFISHIRLSLNACLALFFAGYFLFSTPGIDKTKIFLLLVFIAWMILFLVMIESITGLIIVLVVLYALLIASLFKFSGKIWKVVSIVLLLVIPLFTGIFLNRTVEEFIHPHKNDLSKLELTTASGNVYEHDTVLQPVECGSYVGLYVCESELRSAWNEVSPLDFDGLDEKTQHLKYTLIRYLNSKGLRKDSLGVVSLNKQDIRNVEMGIANIYYTRPLSINSRLYKLLWEYQINKLNGNPGGHSMSQRFEFWRVSTYIIRDYLFFGVGTGDIKQAYASKYVQLDSELEPQFRHRAHNQYLAIFVTFGIVGLLWFVFSLVYPGLVKRKLYTYRYFVFWVTIVISMLVEDTLETQMGVTLFAFFNAFLLFGASDD